MTIDTVAPAAPTIVGIVGSAGEHGAITTVANNPILFGTAQPYSRVTLYYQTNTHWSQSYGSSWSQNNGSTLLGTWLLTATGTGTSPTPTRA